jgi:Na+/proline symporter
MGLIIYTASFAFAEMTGFNILLTTIVIGAITTFYTSVGGLRTVIWTDNLQLWILFGGAVAIPVFIGFQLNSGPAGWWEIFSQAGRTETQVFSFDLTVRITMVGVMAANFFWSICTQGGDQVAIQRYLSTPSVRTARRSIWFFVIADIFLMVFLMVCGLALFAFYAHQSGLPVSTFQAQIAPEADQIMPRFIVEELPSGISGLLLAALLAAAMSSLSSGINSISGVVMSDWAERIPYLKDNPSLRPDKIIALTAGLVGIGAALAIATGVQRTDWNLVELTGRINHIFVGPIAVLFFGGIFFPRAGKGSALQAFLLATLVSLFICFGEEWFGLKESVSFMWVVPIPFLVGLLFLVLCSYFPSPSNRITRRSRP